MFGGQGQGLVEGGQGGLQIHDFHLGNAQIAVTRRFPGRYLNGLVETGGSLLPLALLHAGIALFHPGPDQLGRQLGGRRGQFFRHPVFPQMAAEGGEGGVIAGFSRIGVESGGIGIHRVGKLPQQHQAAGNAAPGIVILRGRLGGQ